MRPHTTIFPLIVALLLLPGPAAAEDDEERGKLDRFEDEATKKDRGDKHKGDKDHHEECDDDDDDDTAALIAWEIARATLFSTVYGGVGSWVRAAGHGPEEFEHDFPPRDFGEPLIPFLSVESSWQEAGTDVSALTLRTEAGYGPFAVEVRSTRWSEDRPDDLLEIRQVHGLYRMSFSRHVEIDVGAGHTTLLGERRRGGGSFTLPVRIQATPRLGFEARPAWAWVGGNTISDVSLLLSGRASFFTLKGGWRRVSAGGTALEGPVIGVGLNL